MEKITFLKKSLWSAIIYLAPLSVFAEEEANGSSGFVGLAAGLAIGIAALGGALGQGRVSGSALEGLAPESSSKGHYVCSDDHWTCAY